MAKIRVQNKGGTGDSVVLPSSVDLSKYVTQTQLTAALSSYTPISSNLISSPIGVGGGGGGGASTLAALTDVSITTPASKNILVYNSSTSKWENKPNYQPLFQRGASFTNGILPVLASNAVDVPIYIPEDCTIVGVEILTKGGTGSCQLDIWKTPIASYPPVIGNSIVASDPPKITSGLTYSDTTLTGWTAGCSAGDTVLVHLTSCSVFTTVMIVLTFKSTGSTQYDGYTDAKAIAAVAGHITSPNSSITEGTSGGNITLDVVGGNPTANVGLTAVNGTSHVPMRSDGAPALDQTITPTWTGNHSFHPGSGVPISIIAGSSSPGTTFEWYDSTSAVHGACQADSGEVYLGSISNHDFYLFTNNTDRVRITSGGSVLLTGEFAINGGSATAKLTGFGSPSGSPTSGLTSASTLAQTAGTLAALLAYLKTIGFIGA